MDKENKDKALYINRILSKFALFEVLRVTIYLAKGMTLSETLIISMYTTIGCTFYNLIMQKINLKPRLMLQISTIFKLIFFTSMLFNNNLIIFCITAALVGMADSISLTIGDSYCYDIKKENYVEMMCIVSTITVISLMSLNMFSAFIIEIKWWLPVAIMILFHIGALISSFFLPDIPYEKKILDYTSLENLSSKPNSSKKLKFIILLYFIFKLYTFIMIRTKVYMIKTIAVSSAIMGYIDVAAQSGVIFSKHLARLKLTLSKLVIVSGVLVLIVCMLAPFTNAIFLLPVLFISPLSVSLILQVFVKEIGENSENIKSLAKIINKVDLAVNVLLMIFLFVFSKVYQTKPYYYSYIVVAPLILLTFWLTYKIKKEDTINHCENSQ